MRLAISGAQSTGKTTIIDMLKKDLLLKGYKFIESPTRSVNKSGLEINERGTDSTQLTMMQEHFTNLRNSPENSIFDRCALDGYVYTTHLYNLKQVSYRTLEIVEDVFRDLIKKYDIICYIPPEFDIVKDDVRSLNKDFRDSISNIFEEYISLYKLPVLRLTGTVQERVQKIKDHIKYFNTAIKKEEKSFKKFENVIKEQIKTLEGK